MAKVFRRNKQRSENVHRIGSWVELALLEAFWRMIDPTDAGGQFADRGSQYRSAIYVDTPALLEQAEASRDLYGQQLAAADPLVRIIDVRTGGEFETMHIPGSFNVPLDTLDEHARDLATDHEG